MGYVLLNLVLAVAPKAPKARGDLASEISLLKKEQVRLKYLLSSEIDQECLDFASHISCRRREEIFDAKSRRRGLAQT